MKKMLCFALVSLLLVVFPVSVLAMEPLRMEPDFMGFPWGTTIHELLTAHGSSAYAEALENGDVRFVFDYDGGEVIFCFGDNSLEYGVVIPNVEQGISTLEDAIEYLSQYGRYTGTTEASYYWDLENLYIEAGTNAEDVLYIFFERPASEELEVDVSESVEQGVTVPQGVWEIGVDIPAGYWTIRPLDGNYASLDWGKELDESGTHIPLSGWYDSAWIYSESYFGYDEGADETSVSWDLTEGTFVTVTHSDVIFTPFAGKPDLGFE